MNGKPGLLGRGTFYQTRRLMIIPDYLKGSYYANPLEDNPVVSTENKKSYPGQSGPVVLHDSG